MSHLIYRSTDVCAYPVRKGERFNAEGHHPILAGTTEEDQKMFVAFDSDDTTPYCTSFSIPDGAENTQILGEDGTYRMVDEFRVLMLRYDPHEYPVDYWYMYLHDDGRHIALPVGNDPTGPFSWKQYGDDDWPSRSGESTCWQYADYKDENQRYEPWWVETNFSSSGMPL